MANDPIKQVELQGTTYDLVAMGLDLDASAVDPESNIKLTDTWKPNTAAQEGYVAAGTGNANKVWGTDENGNPSWKEIASDASKVNKAGDTMTGILVAQNNTAYTTKQVRNVFLSTAEPTSADGANGDIWIQYTP